MAFAWLRHCFKFVIWLQCLLAFVFPNAYFLRPCKRCSWRRAFLFLLAKVFLWEKKVIKNDYIQIASKCLNTELFHAHRDIHSWSWKTISSEILILLPVVSSTSLYGRKLCKENRGVNKYVYEKNVYELWECSTGLVENMSLNSDLFIFHVYSHLGWRSIYREHSWNRLPAFKRIIVGPGTCGICLVPCYW